MVDAQLLGYAAIFLACAAFAGLGLRNVVRAPKPKEGAAAAAPDTDSKLIARKVLDAEGKSAGETVRVEAGEVVLNREGKFLIVPKAALREEGEKLRAQEMDWAEAERKGEEWRKRQEDVLQFDEKGMLITPPKG